MRVCGDARALRNEDDLGDEVRFDLEKQIKIAIEKKVKSKLKFGRALNLRPMLAVLDGGASTSTMTGSCSGA